MAAELHMTSSDGLSMLIERNTRWAARMVDARPDYFSRLANQQSTAVHNALERGKDLSVHGAVYGLNDGRLRVLT